MFETGDRYVSTVCLIVVDDSAVSVIYANNCVTVRCALSRILTFVVAINRFVSIMYGGMQT